VGTGAKRILVDSGEALDEYYVSTLQKVLKDEKASLSTILISHHHQGVTFSYFVFMNNV
jgi:glyoxylase-like metal-dependent hydrolase (beta-lactamase superfamily II)